MPFVNFLPDSSAIDFILQDKIKRDHNSMVMNNHKQPAINIKLLTLCQTLVLHKKYYKVDEIFIRFIRDFIGYYLL